jgi:hypothetical protein
MELPKVSSIESTFTINMQTTKLLPSKLKKPSALYAGEGWIP